MGHSSSIGHADVLSPPLPVVLLSVPGATQRPPQPPHLKPPVPVPMSTISFPLDSTRYYLLGQLEYYLSPQNLAQDFYLRQNMDERGWIPIPLIASFNRVTQLTMDVQLVKDVLTLSSIVQVRGNMVRMGGWEQYVLPDAKPSNVEEQPLPYSYQNLTPYYDGMVGLAGMPGNGIEEYPPGYRMPSLADPTSFPPTSGGISKMAENDEEEDEVEFVMGEVGTWSGGSPDRRT
ncbi:hypothetical protein CPB83DRAFT_763940 [Crepidotus variabilis]|uniref:HTH La-type RNA-binding domain-containing protein n=1 Tax=Crepidotus variabilis TaxID=179855 RepID=A0A9P6JS03_9AGAR|nr:hypothetical protein CPB83DRAFT_763940 [Crepidotus variabilis]